MWKSFNTFADQRIRFFLCQFDKLAQRIGNIQTAILVGVSVWGISLFLYAPPLFIIFTNTSPTRLDDFLAMCVNPFTRNLYEPILAYRIITPFIAYVLGLQGIIAVSIQYTALVLAFALIYIIVKRKTNNVIAMLTCFALSLSHVAQTTNTHWGIPDSVTHLATALAMLTPTPWLIGFATVVGTLNDERFVIAIPFILLWHLGSKDSRLEVKKIIKPLIGFLCGLFIVLIIRYALTVGWIGPGIVIPKLYSQISEKSISNFQPWDSTWLQFLINIFLGYRWVWIIFFVAILKRWNSYNRLFLVILSASVFFATLSTMIVADVSRSTSFFFPAIIISVCLVYDRYPIFCQRILLASVILCILTPCFIIGGGDIQLYRPLPLVLLRTYTNWDILDIFRSRQ